MQKLKQIIREHKIAFILAALVSVVVAFPQVYFRIDHQEFYKDGIAAIEMMPDAPWSARLREVQDGHPNWGNIYYKDGKDDPYLFQPLGSMVVAYTGMLFGLDINNTILLSRILYPALAFLIMYGFVYLISRNKLAASASVSVILIAEPVLRPAGLREWLNGDILNGITVMNFIELTKPVNSAMIFIFLYGFLLAFWQYYRTSKWQWGVLSAVLLGLNFYNYFYSWTYIFGFGGVLYLILLVQRKWAELMKVIYVFCGGLVVALPYIWNLYTVTIHPNYEQLSLRHGVITSHSPEFIGFVSLIAIAVFLIWFPRNDKAKFVFGSALLLAPIITLNQQVITGKILQEGHYHWYAHKPLALMLATTILFYYFEKFDFTRRYKKYVAACMVITAFGVGFTTQALSYKSDGNGQTGGAIAIGMQKYAPVMNWLNEHAEKEAVVFANEEASHVVVIYTPLNVFHHRADQLMLSATDARLEDIVFTFYRLRGVDASEARTFFDREKPTLSSNLFGIHYREREGSSGYDDIPEEIYNGIIKKYQDTFAVPLTTWMYTMLKKYEVEYLVWDKIVNPDWEVEKLPFLKKVAEFGDIAIYEFEINASPIEN